jgi:hypothetical protein
MMASARALFGYQPALKVGVFAFLVLSVIACSPALNWRKVSISSMTVMLPCKPDTAERLVPFVGATLPLQMAGCEADGALFAASHVEALTPATAAAIQQEWQQQALASMQATSYSPLRLPVPAWADRAMQLQASGRAQDGASIKADLRWLVRGSHVYHLAVYGPTLNDTLTELFTLEP